MQLWKEQKKKKKACYCGCCFAKGPEIDVTSVHAAKILRSPEVHQNTCPICDPQMSPDDPSSMFTSCQKLFIVRQFSIYWQFKEESCLLQMLSLTGDLKMSSSVSLTLMVGSFCCSSAKDKNGLLLFLMLGKGSCPLGSHAINPFFVFPLGPSRSLTAGGVRRIWPQSAPGAQYRICFKFFPSSLFPLLVLKPSQMLQGRKQNLRNI